MNKHQYLSKLSLVNFKNYKQAEISFSSEINCLIGPNGAGKTNVLDAIHYLSMCKSYLNTVDSQNIAFEESFFVIQSTWRTGEGEDRLYCGIKRGQKKVFSRNKVEYERLADHIGLYPTVMISPYDRDLIIEGSALRRKWIDGIISQFDGEFLNDLILYNKILTQRNALLKNSLDTGFFDPENLSVWDEQLIYRAEKIHSKRKEMIAVYKPIFQKYYQWLSDDKEAVELEYRSRLSEEDYAQLLRDSLYKDKMRGYTTEGPHKDDLIFTIKSYPIKKFGSQGQQKSFLIALRLAQYEWLNERLEIKPILLLDDIFDKLDNTRVERLMQMVNEQSFGQVIITDTDRKRIASIFEENTIPYKVFYVEENSIKEEEIKTPQYNE